MKLSIWQAIGLVMVIASIIGIVFWPKPIAPSSDQPTMTSAPCAEPLAA
ncbi:MAG: hypothetical protein QM770_21370 [Tepidisphaeraceae bacterium]